MVVAALVILLGWSLWFLAVDPPAWIGLPITVTVVVGALVAVPRVRRWRARRAQRALEVGIAGPEHGRRPAGEDGYPSMQQELQRAVDALKRARVGGRSALSVLPWALLIGPPGSGKTTAVRNSGLSSSPGRAADEAREAGGTRPCTVWLTNELVLLDTAGRWATEAEDPEEWDAFLALLRRYRPETPLNGVLVAVGIDELGRDRGDDTAEQARRIRARIREVERSVETALPVYVLFTKADLVPGFVETFSAMSRDERQQVWGFTVPVSPPPPDPPGYVEGRIGELTAALEARALRRVEAERRIATRGMIHGFPQQFATLRRPTAAFVRALVEQAGGGRAAMLRGCFFTSGTQEGRPIDRVMHGMADAMGLPAARGPVAPLPEPGSYFLRDLFLRVVVPDRDLAGRGAVARIRRRHRHAAAAAVILGAAAIGLVFPGLSWAASRRLLAETRGVVDGVSAGVRGRGGAPLHPEDVRPLREQTEKLRTDRRGHVPFALGFGLYPSRVGPAVETFYATLLAERVVGPVARREAEALARFARRYRSRGAEDAAPRDDERAEAYDRLKLHLLLTHPLEEGEPTWPRDDETGGWLRAELRARWGAAAEVGAGEGAALEEMGRQLALFTEVRGAQDLAPARRAAAHRLPRDRATVAEARRVLSRVSRTRVAVERIIAEASGEGLDLTLTDLIGPVAPMRSAPIVRGAFTREGWESRVRRLLYGRGRRRAVEEPWVLGSEGGARADAERDEEAALRRLRDLYFESYIDEWTRFIRGVRVASAEDNRETLAHLRALTRGDPPPQRLLFEQVLHHTTLPMAEPTAAEVVEAGALSALRREIQRRLRRLWGDGEAAPAGARVDDGDHALGPAHVRLFFDGFTGVGAVPRATADEGEPSPRPPLPIDTYEETLGAVRDALATHLDSPVGPTAALETALQDARTTTRGLIEAQEIGWRPFLERWLWPPIEGATASHANGVAQRAARRWCDDVVTPYRRSLAGGYPMSPTGHDVSLEDFTAFYAPADGTLWATYADVLAGRVRHEGDNYVLAQHLGPRAANALRPELLQYLERAQDVTAVFFPPGSSRPAVDVDVRILPAPGIASQVLCVGGTCAEYRNGPERWVRIRWPGESPEAGASLDARGGAVHSRLEEAGPWGLFRLLEAGTVTSASRDHRVFTVTWRLRDQGTDLSVELRPVRHAAPFFGVPGRRRRPPLMAPVRGPDVDPPREISTRRALCAVR
ncbi:MAG: type VI secretion system membrane subunit TssM [Sandaracinaceae bacterium]